MSGFYINDANGICEQGDVLERIRILDPEVKRLYLHVNDLRRSNVGYAFVLLAHCIRRNKSINEIHIFNHNLFHLRNGVIQVCPVSGIEAVEWKDFFDAVSKSRSIKRIGFTGCCLGGHILKLFDIPNLETVEFRRDRSHHEGWQLITGVLSSPATALKNLTLKYSHITDTNAHSIASGLAHNTTLEMLNLSSLESITAAGFVSIFSSLQNSNTPLKRILLEFNDRINDEVVSLIGEVLSAKKDTIEYFSLYGCSGISSVGWIGFIAACLAPMPNLRLCHIGNQNFDDGALDKLSSGLHNKPCLRKIGLRWANMTTAGWDALSKALCDTSSLDGIRESNHTLHEIDVHPAVSLPPNIKKLLELNKSGTPSEVACLKIIEYSDKITMESLVNDQPRIQFKLVPSVTSHLAKDGNNPNALYHFLRNQSYLFKEAKTKAFAD